MMNITTKFKWVFTLLCVVLSAQSILAQSKAEVFDGKTPVTWLGLDYTQAKYIISEPADIPTPHGAYAKVLTGGKADSANTAFIKTFIAPWNYLFMTESKKFNAAWAIHRTSVDYALSVTEKANNSITGSLVSAKPADFKTLTEQNISDLVKNYDFQGKTGIGMLFFIEGMSRQQDEEAAWVTFVDMNSKTVLYTTYLIGKTGGSGFRNNWADANYRILKQLQTDKNFGK